MELSTLCASPVACRNVDVTDMVANTFAGAPPAVGAVWEAFFETLRDDCDGVSCVIEEVCGVRPRDVGEFVRDHRAAWTAGSSD